MCSVNFIASVSVSIVDVCDFFSSSGSRKYNTIETAALSICVFQLKVADVLAFNMSSILKIFLRILMISKVLPYDSYVVFVLQPYIFCYFNHSLDHALIKHSTPSIDRL